MSLALLMLTSQWRLLPHALEHHASTPAAVNLHVQQRSAPLTCSPTRPRSKRVAAALMLQSEPRQSTAAAPVLARLAVTGATIGPLVDAIHNQALLSYDVAPIHVGPIHTSAAIPFLLALTYSLLGGIFPALLEKVAPQVGLPLFSPLLGRAPLASAFAAIGSTVIIVKASELLLLAHVPSTLATAALYALCALQWAAIDTTPLAALLALAVSIVGPLAELPFMSFGLWHYLASVQDYWPLSSIGLDATTGPCWSGLARITAPCYFAVCTDAIVLGKYFASTLAR
ncbi:hypothetical protein AB1Y20_021942 [Prymnesium parvum]|uniref:Derlin n=1 Tax=Prymnesium parvum TaxID=97485 RepID=A0AB34JGY2_PRYPA